MRTLKQALACLLLLLFQVQYLYSQIRPCSEAEVRALLLERPELSGNFHHHYDIPEISDTKAPRGFRPFYVSHYGRHGERYEINPKLYGKLAAPLSALDSAGLLSKRGKEMLDDIILLGKEHEGMWGILTAKGAATHRGIASRMYSRYPRVFSQKGRDSVICYSTTVHRCLLSMGNFCLSLKEKEPSLKISVNASDASDAYLNPQLNFRPGAQEYSEWRDSVLSCGAIDTFLGIVAADPSAAASYFGKRPADYLYNLMHAVDITQCLDGSQPDFFRYFTPELIWTFWYVNNAKYIIYYGHSSEFGDARVHGKADRLLGDFIERADRAVEGSGVCADLRFGHDTATMPLVTLLDLNGLGSGISAFKSPWLFPAFRAIPMAANVQMIFYRNSKGDVLVKVLLNEQETSIPGLSGFAVQGVYYPWERFREYCIDRIHTHN